MDQEGLLAEVRSLRKLAEDLEKRVTDQTTTSLQQPSNDNNGTNFPFQDARSPFVSTQVDVGTPASSSFEPVSEELVAHLERVSMGQGSYESIGDNDEFVFKIDQIRDIPLVRSRIPQPGRSTRYIFLPRREEAKVLLNTFVNGVGYIQHVVHYPSLPNIIDEIYRQIAYQEPVKLGPVVLLLSIIASATHVWGPHDGIGHENYIFSSLSQANAQTLYWVKTTYDVLGNGGWDGPPVAQETIQGIIILSFLLCNLEGVSLRYRSLISTGLLLGREIGLHRIDKSNTVVPNTIWAETGRRAWWYLATTDWLLAARYGDVGEGVYQTNPRHMCVKKPRNINDIDLIDGGMNLGLPANQLTDMSYFLQRIRLAEISRDIVDRHHDSQVTTSSDLSSYHSYALDMNTQLDQMIQEIPHFFRLDSYERNPSSMSCGTFIQAYMLNSIVHTQRCKLHLSYLTSKLINDPTHASRREKCLDSARQIVHAEAQLEKTPHPFGFIRLRLSGILYGVFMAGIVLLMDDCVNGQSLHPDGVYRNKEAAEALRIIEAARSQSLAAANLHNLLVQVLAKHRAQQQQKQQQQQPSPWISGPTPPASINPPWSHTTGPIPARSFDTLNNMPSSSQAAASGPESGLAEAEPPITTPDLLLAASDDQTAYYNSELPQSLSGPMDLDGFPWDDLLSGMDSTSFAF